MIKDDNSGVVQFLCRDNICESYRLAMLSLRGLLYTEDCVIVPNA